MLEECVLCDLRADRFVAEIVGGIIFCNISEIIVREIVR
jgi:hypothetical protein